MNRVDLLSLLCNEGLVIQTGENDYVTTNKFKRLMAGQQVPIIKEPDKKLPVDLLSPDELLKKFVKDAEIPFRVPSPGDPKRSYTITARSKEAIKAFYNIMLNKKMEYNDMVEATKAYYKYGTYRKTLSNYILEGVLDVYVDEYIKAKTNNKLSISTPQTSNKVSL